MSLPTKSNPMTTHVYKDYQVVSDSQVTSGMCRIDDDEYDKVFKYNNLTIFICGDPNGVEGIIKAFMSEGPIESPFDVGAFVWDSRTQTLWQVGVDEGKSSKYMLDNNKHYTIGSGSPYALGALDAGATSKEAMKIAMKRDIFTGGRMRVTKLK